MQRYILDIIWVSFPKMACSPIFGTHGIRASQVLHDHLLLTSRIMSSMDVKMVRSFFMGYGYLTKHFSYQKWRMYTIENPPQKIRLTKVSIPAFFGYLKPFGDSCTCTRRCLKRKHTTMVRPRWVDLMTMFASRWTSLLVM